MKRWLFLLFPLGLLGAGCGQPASDGPRSAAPSTRAPHVYLARSGSGATISVVDPATGAALRTLPTGTPSPDWRWLYSVAGSSIQVVNPVTGDVAFQVAAPAWAATVRTSANGRWLVFTEATPGSTVSRFLIRDSSLAHPPTAVSLQGTFSFDGISDDGSAMYLLQWVGQGHYSVRRYDLPERRLYPNAIVDKSDGGGPMSGQGADSVTTRDGATQLTLYQRDAEGRSFVHVLPMASDGAPFAFCVDLPASDHGWTLVAAPDRETFYAVNPAQGSVVRITPRSGQEPAVAVAWFDRTRYSPPAETSGLSADRPAAVVSPDGSRLYFAGAGGVVAVSTTTMRVVGWADGASAAPSPGSRIESLAFDPTGQQLFGLEADRLLTIDPHGLRVSRWVTLQVPVTFAAIVRVA